MAKIVFQKKLRKFLQKERNFVSLRRGLNPQPLDYKSSVLTITLQNQVEEIRQLWLPNSKSAKNMKKILFAT